MLPRNLQISACERTIQDERARRSTHQSVLYSDVAGPRCVGYAISVMRTGAAAAANVSPKPIKNLRDMSGPGYTFDGDGVRTVRR